MKKCWPNDVLNYDLFIGFILLRNGVIKSIGNGKMIVEFFSLEILLRVCKYLNCNAAGLSLSVSAASFNALDAFISPSAAITLARASLI